MDIIILDSGRRVTKWPVIDESKLQLGDLVLTSPRAAFASGHIKGWQEFRGFGWDDARWTHAAIYAGCGSVVEAIRPGISKTPLAEYVADYLIRFRRSRWVSFDLGAMIVKVAADKLGSPYSYKAGVKARRPASDSDEEQSAFNCASLYADAFNKVMNQYNHELWTESAKEIALPAELSRTDQLQDVVVGWLSQD